MSRWPVPLHWLEPNDAAWPSELEALPDPPARLRVAGTVPPLAHAVGVVGTRHADAEGADFTRELAFELAKAGVVIVSGGARGIDIAAHEGALEAAAPTVAVLASGLATPYPAAHRPLFERVAETGAVLSEGEDDRIPHPGRFLERNRLVAALTQAIVVVQAPARSGALSTAAHAKRLGRTVFAVPTFPTDPRGAGCLALLRQGARVCTRARDILSLVVLEGGLEERKSGNAGIEDTPSGLDEDGRAMWACLGTRPRHVDELARASGLPVARAQRAMVGLMLLGLADEREGGFYVRSR